MTGWKADCWPRLVRFPLDVKLFPRAMGEGVGALLSMNVTAGDDVRAFDALVEFWSIPLFWLVKFSLFLAIKSSVKFHPVFCTKD